jgi:hypothetical protein
VLKLCKKCCKDKSLDEFGSDKNTSDCKNRWCKVCVNAWRRVYDSRPDVRERRRESCKRSYHKHKEKHLKKYADWKDANKDYFISSRRYMTYGILPDQFDEIFEAQGRRCAICRSDSPGRGKAAWSLDHDHETNEIRGVLCHKCNMALGLFKDSANTLMAAAEYVSKTHTGLFAKKTRRMVFRLPTDEEVDIANAPGFRNSISELRKNHPREYGSWVRMNFKAQHDCIPIKPEWTTSFKTFLDDVGTIPEHLDNVPRVCLKRFPGINGPYEPGNVVWMDHKTKGRLSKTSKIIEFNGKSQNIAEWSRELGIGRTTLNYRLKNGWSSSRALTTPV